MDRVTWTSQMGAQVAVTLRRNVALNAQGRERVAETHIIDLEVADRPLTLQGEIIHPEHGYCLRADMGRIVVRVPDECRDQVEALLAEARAAREAQAARMEALDRWTSERVARVASGC